VNAILGKVEMLGGLRVCNLFVSWERATTLISFYEASICKMKSCRVCITVLGTKRREENRSNILKGHAKKCSHSLENYICG